MNNQPNTLYKLMILYMLKKIRYSMTYAQISDFVLGRGYTDYFPLQTAVAELKEGGLVHVETLRNSSFYRITPEGEETLGFFSGRIPSAIREDIDAYLKEHKMAIIEAVSVLTDYYRVSGGDYEVRLRVREKDTDLIDLRLNVPTDQTAETMCANWRGKSQAVYAYLMRELMRSPEKEE